MSAAQAEELDLLAWCSTRIDEERAELIETVDRIEALKSLEGELTAIRDRIGHTPTLEAFLESDEVTTAARRGHLLRAMKEAR